METTKLGTLTFGDDLMTSAQTKSCIESELQQTSSSAFVEKQPYEIEHGKFILGTNGNKGTSSDYSIHFYKVNPNDRCKATTYLGATAAIAFYSTDDIANIGASTLVGSIVMLGKSYAKEFDLLAPEGSKTIAVSFYDQNDAVLDAPTFLIESSDVRDVAAENAKSSSAFESFMFENTYETSGFYTIDIKQFKKFDGRYVQPNGAIGFAPRASTVGIAVQPGQQYKISTRLESNIGIGMYDDGIADPKFKWGAGSALSVIVDSSSSLGYKEYDVTVPEQCNVLRVSNCYAGDQSSYIETKIQKLFNSYAALNVDGRVDSLSGEVQLFNIENLPKIDFDYRFCKDKEEYVYVKQSLYTPSAYCKSDGTIGGGSASYERYQYNNISAGQVYKVRTNLNSTGVIGFYSAISKQSFISCVQKTASESNEYKDWIVEVPEGAKFMLVTNCKDGSFKDCYTKLLGTTTYDYSEIMSANKCYNLAKRSGFEFKPFDKAQVVLKFDDNRPSHGYVASFISSEYGFPMTFAAIPRGLDAQLSASYEEDGTTYTSPWSTFKELYSYVQQNGGEVLMHYGDKDIFSNGRLSEQQAYNVLREAMIAYEYNGIHNVQGFVTDSHVNCSDYTVQLNKYFDYGLMAQGASTLPQFKLDYYSYATQTQEAFENKINGIIENNSYIVVYAHSIPEDSFTMASLKQRLDFLKQKQDAGLLQVTTLRDMWLK